MLRTILSYYTLAALSAVPSPMRFIDADKITFADGVHQVLNFKKNELISLSNHDGTVKMIIINVLALEVSEIERIRLVIQKEISRKIGLEAWNEKYAEDFKTTQQLVYEDDVILNNMSQEQLEREIRNDAYQ